MTTRRYPTVARPRRASVLLAAAALGLTACADRPFESDELGSGGDTGDERQRARFEDNGSILGGDGLTFGGPQEDEQGGGSGIGVNSFLWRASLDTLSFLPITSADPFGGVILTDWYTPPEAPEERFKLNVFILDRQLRADGVRVSAFRQVRDGPAGWQDAAIDPATESMLEETILTRARELRIGAL